MKFALLVLIALNIVACATTPDRWEWDATGMTPDQLEKLKEVHAECTDFAYRAKVAGSRFTEVDIQTSCIQRKGYTMRKVGG